MLWRDIKSFGLDAANYAKEAWEKVTDNTIKHFFIKAGLRINLNNAKSNSFKNDEFLKLFQNLNIKVTVEYMDEFVTIDRRWQ